MVAVTHREAEKFIAGSASRIDLFLIFGTDSGLVSERTSAILRKAGLDPKNPDQILKLDGDEIAGEPGRLYEEAHGSGLFAEKRAIILRAGSKQLIAALETIIENPSVDCKILVQAGALRRDAPLRALATRARNAAAIECYPDQTADVERLIDSELKSAGLTIEPGAKNALSGLLGDDRLSTRAELEKLILYCHGKGRVSEEDVINAVADASAFALDNVVFAAFSGDVSFLGDSSAHIYASANEVFALIAAATRHAYLLNQIRIEVEAGGSVETAIERSAARSVFGSRRDALVSQARHWRRDSLAQCIVDLNQTTLETRREASLSSSIAMQSLLNVARKYRTLRAPGQ